MQIRGAYKNGGTMIGRPKKFQQGEDIIPP